MNVEEKPGRDAQFLGINLYYKLSFDHQVRTNDRVRTFARTVGFAPARAEEMFERFRALDPREAEVKDQDGRLEARSWEQYHRALEAHTVLTEHVLRGVFSTEEGRSPAPAQVRHLFRLGRSRLRGGGVAEGRKELRRYFLRNALFEHYRKSCAACGLSGSPSLAPVRILPSAGVTSIDQLVDPANHLLLCPHHREAFLENRIRIDPDSYTVIVTEEMDMEEKMTPEGRRIMSLHGNKLVMPDRFPPEKEYLRRRYQVMEKKA